MRNGSGEIGHWIDLTSTTQLAGEVEGLLDTRPVSAFKTPVVDTSVMGRWGWSEVNFFHHDNPCKGFVFMAQVNAKIHQSELPAPPKNWQEVQEHRFKEELIKAAEAEIEALENKGT